MGIEEVRLGTLIEIYIQRDGYNYKVVSKIELISGNIIAVSPIASKQRIFRFLPTDKIDLVYHQDDKTIKWMRVRPEIVVDEDGNKLHGFVCTSDAETFNRRLTYRLLMNKSLKMYYLQRDEAEPDGESSLFDRSPDRVVEQAMDLLGGEKFRWVETPCFIKDLSEGGVALQTDTVLVKGDEIWFEFDSPEGLIVCKAVVVRVKTGFNGYYSHSYGCCFSETSKNFTKFLFAEQRRELIRMKSEKEKRKLEESLREEDRFRDEE